MNNQTNWTPGPEENKLNLTDFDQINQKEAEGFIKSELQLFDLEEDEDISINIILELHKIAFEALYDWAGKWRMIDVSVGQIKPPSPKQIPNLMYQYIDNLNFKVQNAKNKSEQVATIVYGHYEFIKIHPFNNGNGRTGRLIMNWVCLKFGYKPITLYAREGESRRIYIDALQKADRGDFQPLEKLIEGELELFS